jgi:hypothetical protein
VQHAPDLNALAALTERRLDGDERDRLLAHVGGCRQCRELLSLMARGSPGPEPRGQRPYNQKRIPE